MPTARLARLIAALGAFVWAVTLVVPTAADSWETLLIQKILLFAILVIVPLGLSLVLGFADIPTMAKTHGVMNAFGFTLCALIAWSLEAVNPVKS